VSQTGNAEYRRRLHADILGPRDHLEFHRFRRLRAAIERLHHPWDAILVSAMAGGLYATSVLGALVITWWPGSMPAGIVGILTIGTAGVLAAHLVLNRA
jgi:hypothetical protein